ncbi:MAG: Ig-like domain-containing protein [Candidatus Methylomirabilales bacterium]
MRTETLYAKRKVWITAILLCLTVVLGEVHPISAAIRVVSPPDGSTFEPGASVTVAVEPEGPTPLQEVVIVTKGIVGGAQSAPFEITFLAPQELGPKLLAVFARDQNSNDFTKELTYTIETPTPVESIEVRSTIVGQPASVDLIAGVTEQVLSVEGTFTDGMNRDITKSSETTYTSSNPQVATVSTEGFVEAVDNGTATITVTYKDKSVTVPVTVDFTPRQRLEFICHELQAIVDSNPGTTLADKVEDAVAKCRTALDELKKTPPDGQAALGTMKDAVAKLEAAINEGLDPQEGTKRMDQLTRTARQLATEALDQAIDQGGDSGKIADAQEALGEGDALRASSEFRDAAAKYREALQKAESALP